MKTKLLFSIILVIISITIVSLVLKSKNENSSTAENFTNKMEPKIVEKSEIKVVGFGLQTSFTDERNKTEIPPFFHKVLEDGKLETVHNRVNANQLCVFKMEKDNPDFTYTMGVEVLDTQNSHQEMTSIVLPESKYVAIRIIKRGPEDVGKAFGYIYKEYIPNSIYVPTGEPAFIYYDEDFFSIYNEKGYAGNPLATVYVPVKPLLIKQMANAIGLLKQK
jgi:predicted transcriptional regulator YdeE